MKFNGIFLLYSMGSLSKMAIILGSLTHVPEITQVFSSYLSDLSLFLAFFLLTNQRHSSLKAEAELFAIQLYYNFSFSSLLNLHYYLLLSYLFCLFIIDYRQVFLHCIFMYFLFHLYSH